MATPNLREEYFARINRVMDYIDKNLEQELALETLARVANFSPFHFHRIFHALVGETLNQFIQRLRLEKAAYLLINNPKKSITEIAFDCGFSGSATFARAFRELFSVSASAWRSGKYLEDSKICKSDSKISEIVRKMRKDFDLEIDYIESVIFNQQWRIQMKNKQQFQVEVKEMPELPVAYVRHIGPYKGDSQLFGRLINKLMKWAGPRGLVRPPETQLLMVYHDNPEITEESKLRLSVCLTVPADTPVDGEIGKMTIPPGKYAFAHFELKPDDYQQAWDAVFSAWLPESGYQPDDRPCYELCLNDPKEHPEGKHVVDIVIPVKPL